MTDSEVRAGQWYCGTPCLQDVGRYQTSMVSQRLFVVVATQPRDRLAGRRNGQPPEPPTEQAIAAELPGSGARSRR